MTPLSLDIQQQQQQQDEGSTGGAVYSAPMFDMSLPIPHADDGVDIRHTTL